MEELTSVYRTSGRYPELYNDAIITFDIETSSLFSNSDGTIKSTTDLEKDDERLKFYACMYLWTTSINGVTYYGRTMDELKEYLQFLMEQDGKKIIWIHNLSYEFQFLLNYLFDYRTDYELSVFARSRRKPMKVLFGSLEFRCTYMLTNCSLAKVSEIFHLPIQKKEGDLDYRKARGYTTRLTKKELDYAEYDVLVLHYLILAFLKLYKTLDRIPLTSTGRIRRECVALMRDYVTIRKQICKEFPTVDFYEILRKMFMGGYTHSNPLNTAYILSDVDGYDLSSSYPAAMVSEKYPFTRFNKISCSIIEHNPKWIRAYHIRFNKIEVNGCMSYLSFARVEKCLNAEIDNGRIRKADWVECYLTDIDVDIVLNNYDIETYEILEAWQSFARYLPRPFLEYIFKLYENKTSLKDVEGAEDEYAQSKAFINALYGMMVTNDIRDEVIFDIDSDENWTVRNLTRDEVKEELKEKSESHKTFLLYQWGVWVTAYARRNLWSLIKIVNQDLVYTDTDSLKLIHSEKYKKDFDEYNQQITQKVMASIEYNDLNVNYPPKDIYGKEHPIGIYEHEKGYPVKMFKTLGAKKYCYVDQEGETHLTLSGVRKSAVKDDKEFSIKKFKKGYVFTKDVSGRTTARYISDQQEFRFIDYLGKEQIIPDQRYIINLEPTSYTLDITVDYYELLHETTKLKCFGEMDYG